ncbi:MAG: hypothetical protein MJ211_01275 [Bacteroidales bacterium]|nr:hypothetical protein [Bacteroidales bacterium]
MTYENLEITLEDVINEEDVAKMRVWLAELCNCRFQLMSDHPDYGKPTCEYFVLAEKLNEMIRHLRGKIKEWNKNQSAMQRIEAKARREQKRLELIQKNNSNKAERAENDEKMMALRLEAKKIKQQNMLSFVFMEAAKHLLDKHTYNFILEEAQTVVQERLKNSNNSEEDIEIE